MNRVTPLSWQTRGMPALPIADHAMPWQAAGLYEPCVLLKLGEIVLKGKNRQQFERLLADNIRRAIRDLGLPVQLRQREGVIVLTLAPGQPPGAARPGAARPGAARPGAARPAPGLPEGIATPPAARSAPSPTRPPPKPRSTCWPSG